MEKRLHRLLQEYGYRLDGHSLVSVGIRGFTSSRIVCRVRDIWDACEYLIPIIRDDDFTDAVHGN